MQCNIQDLDSAADAENRPAFFSKQTLEQIQFHGITQFVDGAARRMDRFTVPMRMHVRAAAEEHTLAGCKIGIQNGRVIGERQENRNTACTQDGVIIAAVDQQIPLIVTQCRCNDNSRFLHGVALLIWSGEDLDG